MFAECYPVGRDEFHAAGQSGYKPSFRADVWADEYSGEVIIEIDGKRYDIYRTYGPKGNGKIELYASERAGKK